MLNDKIDPYAYVDEPEKFDALKPHEQVYVLQILFGLTVKEAEKEIMIYENQ